MASVKYRLNTKSDNAQIYLQLSLGRKVYLQKKTGLSINPKYWGKNGFPKQTYADTKNIKSKLNNLKVHILDEVNESVSKGEDITRKWLELQIDIFFKRVNIKKESEFVTDAIDNITSNASTRKNGKGGIGLSKSRLDSYKWLKKIISKYESSIDRKVKVKEVDISFTNKFLDWLVNTEKYAKSTSVKKIKDLKTVCYDAEANGAQIHPQLKKIANIEIKPEKPIFLNFNELDRIKKVPLLKQSLINARKWLLLGCDIGQRGDDILNITEKNFHIESDGRTVLRLRQKKGFKTVTIPLFDDAREIYENGLPYKISIQKFNKYCKDICKIAGINEVVEGKKIFMVNKDGKPIAKDKDGKYKKKGVKRQVYGKYKKYELIGSHVCRRSFATNYADMFPNQWILNITGHSTEKILQKYIGKDSSDYAKLMSDFLEIKKMKEENMNKKIK